MGSVLLSAADHCGCCSTVEWYRRAYGTSRSVTLGIMLDHEASPSFETDILYTDVSHIGEVYFTGYANLVTFRL